MNNLKPDYDHIDVLDYLTLAQVMAVTHCGTLRTYNKYYGDVKPDVDVPQNLWSKNKILRTMLERTKQRRRNQKKGQDNESN